MTPEDFDLLMKISERAKDAYNVWAGEEYPDVAQTDFFQQLELAHRYCPLDLPALLKADDYDFANDVCGINRNINHKTKSFDNFFHPRHALKQ